MAEGWCVETNPDKGVDFFSRVEEDGTILIVLKGIDFGLDVKVDDIDWEAYRKSNEHGGHPFRRYVDR